MKSTFLLFISLLSMGLTFAQVKQNVTNLIPNPSFEDRVGCPFTFGFGTLPNVTNWVTAGSGTSDYLNECGFQGFPAPPNSPAGNGYVGFANSGSSNEYVGVVLNSPIVAGSDLELQFVSASSGGAITFAMTLYGTPDATGVFPWTGVNCPIGQGNWITLGSVNITYSGAGWVTSIINFIAPTDINAIALGPPCGPPQNGSGYFYLDGLELMCTTILPVEATLLEAECEEGDVRLSWTTISEQNNDFFTIERSCDGVLFEEIADIQGIGNSTSPIDYSYIDVERSCTETVWYYKIKQTDLNGMTKPLHTASVSCISDEVEINDFSEYVTIHYNEKFHFRLISVDGKIVTEKEVMNGYIKLEKALLGTGLYFIQVIDNNKQTLKQQRVYLH